MPSNEILIYGVIGDDVLATDIIKRLAAIKGDVIARINSPGGDVFAGIAIYNALRSHGNIHIVIDALAASAASLIACAGDIISMRANAAMMIHDPSTWAEGTASDMQRSIEALTRIKDAMIAGYVRRTGLSAEKLMKMMSAETWLTADEALAAGFVDEILTDDPASLRVAAQFHSTLPQWFLTAAARGGALPAKPSAVETIMPESDTRPAVDPATVVMPKAANDNTIVAKAANDNASAIKAAADEAVANERKRIVAIADLCGKAEMPERAHEFTAAGTSVDDARVVLFDAMTARAKPVISPARVANDNVDPLLVAGRMAEALACRFGCGAVKEVPADARQYMAYSVHAMAEELLQARGERTRGMYPYQMFKAALSTSDFPYLLASSANKILLAGYAQPPRTFMNIATRRDLKDFKTNQVIRLGDFPNLEFKPEGAEVTYGKIGESQEALTLKTYARGVPVTREMLINDDLNAFGDIAGMVGAAVARLESRIFWALITSNVLLSDGVALFSTASSRKNQASTSDALSAASLGAGRLAMRKQTSIDGNPIGFAPKFLVIPAALENTADQLLSGVIYPTTAATIVPGELRGLTVVIEPMLDAASATSWYLVSSPAEVNSFYYGYLQGQEAPIFEREQKPGVDVNFIVLRDFAAAAVDFRGVYKNVGA